MDSFEILMCFLLTLKQGEKMKEREAKLLCESKDFSEAKILQSIDDNGWKLRLVTTTGTEDVLEPKRSSSARIFKTLDAAINCCKSIGLKNVEVVL